MKNVGIRSFFWSVFSRIPTEYRDLQIKSRYLVRMRVNTNQINSEYGHILHSEILKTFERHF